MKPEVNDLSAPRPEGDDAGPAPRPQAMRDMPAGLLRFANGVLWCAAALFASNLFFAFHLRRKLPIVLAVALGLGLTLGVRLLGKPLHRLSLALSLLPAIFALSCFELYLGWKRPHDGTAALRRGESFDSRGTFEVVDDLRKERPDVVPYVIPRMILTQNYDMPGWKEEALAHVVRPDWGIEIDGVRTLPFAGVSKRTTVFCNEGGTRAVYTSDEHGFNNPQGIWGQAPLDVVVLGDSYSQGACVPQDKIPASLIRKRYPKTLTLGMCANGPLMEYADLKELAADLKPRIVLWVYYNNDLSDMDVEAQSELLMRYVDDDGFRQGLAARQPAIDAALERYLGNIAARAPRWPSSLAGMGLTRQSTPLVLQDLVMREQHSSWSSLLRLDGVTASVTMRFLSTDYFAQPPKWALFRRVLSQAKSTIAGWGGKMYFVYLPDVHFLRFHGAKNDAHREPVLELVRELGIPLIDLHPVYLAQPDPEAFRPHHDAHFNDAGFALAAEKMLEALAGDGL